jgi:IS4 transposase
MEMLIEHPFRLIEVETLDKVERLIFITNIWDLNAMQIARIYRQRWDIEVFFRFLKQQLGIKHLINRSENGVQIQIYCALIAAILLLVFKITNKISGYKTAKLLFAEQLFILFVNELNAKNPP